jgi:stage V sporulation protein S
LAYVPINVVKQEFHMSETQAPNSGDGETILRVKSSSNASALAAAVSHGVYEGKQISLRAIGAGAVNQAIKALAIAQSFVGSRGYSLSFRPGFTTVTMPEGDVTAILLKVVSN